MALKDITLGQFFPGNSVVHRLDSRTKLICVVLYIVALFLAAWFVTYAVMLAVLAGFFIAMGGAVTNTASHSIANVGAARVVCGLLFPFGLAMVILTGAELFTGNTLLVISVLERRTTTRAVLRSWVIVYLGNAAGAVLTAAGCAFGGQLQYSGGQLAVFTMRLAAGKCSLGTGSAVILGVLCNVLVTTGVLLALSAKDLPGRVMGAYLPVAFFVICGFEHCIANLFYIPAGLFAQAVPAYAALAADDRVRKAYLGA